MSQENDDSLAGLNRPLVSSDFPSLHSLVQDSGDTTPFNSPRILANLSRESLRPGQPTLLCWAAAVLS